jgi:hypothetical protein
MITVREIKRGESTASDKWIIGYLAGTGQINLTSLPGQLEIVSHNIRQFRGRVSPKASFKSQNYSKFQSFSKEVSDTFPREFYVSDPDFRN